jgi:hypothetical protein
MVLYHRPWTDWKQLESLLGEPGKGRRKLRGTCNINLVTWCCAASCNNETTICDGGAASPTTVPPAARTSDGSTDRVRKVSHFLMWICHTGDWDLEACNDSSCEDCLQEWSKKTNTCPTDGQVCDIILKCRCLWEEVVRRSAWGHQCSKREMKV